jgi:transposase-like protein
VANWVFDAAQFKDEKAAFAYVEAHLWCDGRACPHCGVLDQSKAMNGKTTRPGLYKCYACRKPFTVRMGSIFEGSHLALHMWLQVIHLMCASKKGISTRQIQRMLNCSMKTAWFLGHRIREVMTPGVDAGPIGGRGKVVEVDENYLLKSADAPLSKQYRAGGYHNKMKVLTLVERGGEIRSMKFEDGTRREIGALVRKRIHPESILHTDGSRVYVEIGASTKHEIVDHSTSYVGYVLAGRNVDISTLEGFFSTARQHLNR